MSINEILAIDRNFRYTGITDSDDLHTISNLQSDCSLDYDLPTLVTKDFDYNQSIKLCNNIDDFKAKFYEEYPFLNGLDMSNMLIAGGSVGENIKRVNRYGSNCDVDFFIYGLDVDQANIRIKSWITDLISCAKAYVLAKHNSESEKNNKKKPKINYDSELNCEMIRNNNTLLINILGKSIQLIFRLYKSKSEILHGFDLGSSAVGFDGEQVYLTSLGKFCYEHSCNIIDTTRRSTTYEYRLEKYFNRGFNIVLPSLNIAQLRKEYFQFRLDEVCILPYFVFSYSDIIGNKIVVDQFYNKYSETSDYKIEDINEYNSFQMNLYNIVNDVDYFYYTSSSIDEIEILSKPPRLSKGSVVSFYEILRKDLNHSKIDVGKLKRYLPCESASVIAKNMIENTIPNYLNSLIDNQIKIVLEKLEKLHSKDHTRVRWITENPGSQLCGSFNPIFKDEKDWYGPYFTTNICSTQTPMSSTQTPSSLSCASVDTKTNNTTINNRKKVYIEVCDNCGQESCCCCEGCGDHPCCCEENEDEEIEENEE